MIEVNTLVTLDDNKEYLVIGRAEYEKIMYYYLIEVSNKENTKYCYLEGNNMIEVNDIILVRKIVPLLLENVIASMKKLKNDNK